MELDQEMEQALLAHSLQWGTPIPEHIQNAPELGFGLEVYSRAFSRLGSCRSLGMGIGPIPWTSIQEYCEKMGYDSETTADMHYLLARMDNAYLEHVNKKSE